MRRRPLFHVLPGRAAVILAAFSAAACNRPPAGPHAAPAGPPARVEGPRQEEDLTKVILTEEAEARLGVKLAAIERQKLPRRRTLGGEGVVPHGRSAVVSAPVAGVIVKAAEGTGRLVAGGILKKGQLLFSIRPILTPAEVVRLAEARVDAEGQVEVLKIRVEAATKALHRTENLARTQTGTEKALDDARAEMASARAALAAAGARSALLERETAAVDAGSITAIPIACPEDGVLMKIHALEGQPVAAGGALFEVAKLQPLWVRVPIYAGDLAQVDATKEASVVPPSSGSGAAGTPAKPVQAPPAALPDMAIVSAPNEIKREGASRRIDVTCNVSGRDLGSVASEIERRVGKISFERGYHPELLGEYAAREAAKRRLFTFAGLSLVAILLILHADFRSVRLTALLFLTLPFALIGGVAAAFLAGGVLSLGSLVGFVTVIGIAARNGILLMSHYRHLEEEEGVLPGLDLVIRGAEERLIPILMTASCAGLALLPLVVRGNVPGHEIEYPMAVVILGGLVTSTLLNLFLLPALYGWARGRAARGVGPAG